MDGIKFNPTNQKIYTANGADDTVSVIDANPLNATGTYRKLIDTIPIGVNPASVTVDSAVNEVEVELDTETRGPPVCVQVNCKTLPSGSELASPSSVTERPSFTTWSGPALAIGGLFAVKSMTLTVPVAIPNPPFVT